MREHPILFSTEMVKAIMEGRKTQTRRIITDSINHEPIQLRIPDDTYKKKMALVPELWKYKAGDNLWVREAFFLGGIKPDEWVSYKADIPSDCWPNYVWHPLIFLPRKFARLSLNIIRVEVQRVQEIEANPEDFRAEGYKPIMWTNPRGERVELSADFAWYEALWDSINGKKCTYRSNPWVWVITFKRIV